MSGLRRITALLSGIGILLIGNGLLGSLLGIRAAAADFAATTIGIMMSAYFLGFILGSLTVLRLVQAVGHIRTFSVLASLGSTVIIVHGLTGSAPVWILMRLIGGYCLVGLAVVVESWLYAETTPFNRGSVFSVYMATTLLALGAGQFLLVLDDGERFLTFGLASILFSVGLIPVALTRVEEPARMLLPRFGARRLLGIAPTSVVAMVTSGVAASSFWGMGAVFAQGVGFDRLQIAAFMSTVIFGGVVLQLPIGRWSDRVDRRRILAATCLVGASCAGAGWAALDVSRPLFLALAFVYGGCAFAVYGLAAAHAIDHLQRDQVLPATGGLLRLYGMGAVAGPVLSGWVMMSWGAASFLLFLAAVQLPLMASLVVRVRRVAPLPPKERGEYVPMMRTTPMAMQMHPEGGPVSEDPAVS